MRTALTLTLTAAFALVTGAVFAEHQVSKADYYYKLYVDTLDEAREAAEKGHWDEYNELYQKAQYYRREYEFYRNGAAGYPVTTYRTYSAPEVRYEYYTSPQVYYYTPSPYYYYTPGLSFGYYGSGYGYYGGHRSGSRHHGSDFGRHSGSRGHGSSFGRHSGSRGHGSGFGGHSGSRGHSSGGHSSGGGHRSGGHSGGGRGHR